MRGNETILYKQEQMLYGTKMSYTNKRSLDRFGPTLTGSHVLVRADLDVPLDEHGNITNDRLIKGLLPTIEYILDWRATIIIMAHLDQPKGSYDPRLSLTKINQRLHDLLDLDHKSLLHHQVELAPGIIGQNIKKFLSHIGSYGVLLLENLRFDPRELQNDAEFGEELASMGGYYVNDAFAECNSLYSSLDTTARQFPNEHRMIGLNVKKELQILDKVLEHPQTPSVLVLGGDNPQEKLSILGARLDNVDHVLIGSEMAQILFDLKKGHVNTSILQSPSHVNIRPIMDQVGEKIVIPSDFIVSRSTKFAEDTHIAAPDLEEGYFPVDIGPQTIKHYENILSEAKTIIWNGPLGVVESQEFTKGTEVVATLISECNGISVAGGANTQEFIDMTNLWDRFTHVSTGRKAFVEILKGGRLSALDNIDDIENKCSQKFPTKHKWHSNCRKHEGVFLSKVGCTNEQS